jgi:hypothetical protein
MTEYQKEVNTTIESFWQAAQAKRGRVMGEREVAHVAAYISGLTEGIMGLENQLGFVSNMLAAYTNEFGENLMKTLTEQNVVEGEVINDTETEESASGLDDESSQTTGRDSENERLDAPSEEEE